MADESLSVWKLSPSLTVCHIEQAMLWKTQMVAAMERTSKEPFLIFSFYMSFTRWFIFMSRWYT
jgi:hypothetical protein